MNAYNVSLLKTRVAEYVRELNSNSVVSRSHITLQGIYSDFGRGPEVEVEILRQVRKADQAIFAQSGHLAFTDVDSFDELFIALNEKTSRRVKDGDHYTDLSTWFYHDARNGDNGIYNWYVEPNRRVIDYVKANTIEGTKYFSAIDRGDNQTLIVVQYDQIIGSRWLALVRTDSLPTRPKRFRARVLEVNGERVRLRTSNGFRPNAVYTAVRQEGAGWIVINDNGHERFIGPNESPTNRSAHFKDLSDQSAGYFEEVLP